VLDLRTTLLLAMMTVAGTGSYAAGAELGIVVPPVKAYPGSRFVCPARLESLPVDSAMPSPFVDDGRFDRYDPGRYAQFNQARKPFDGARFRVVKNGEIFMSGIPWAGSALRMPGDRAAADCTIRLLDQWASDGALLGRMSVQALDYTRFLVPSFSLGYLIAAGDRPIDPAVAARIEGWLRQLNDRDIALMDYRVSKGTANNHLYWVGYAALLVGLATDDSNRVAWGVTAINHGLDAIGPDGLLPREVARNTRALHYHAYAAQALAMGALVMEANGYPVAPARRQRLLALGRSALDGYQDPAAFVRAVKASRGVALPGQSLDGVEDTLAFLEPMMRLFPSERSFPAAARRYGPFQAANVGMNTSVLFSRTP
jgi:hypothetical protein